MDSHTDSLVVTVQTADGRGLRWFYDIIPLTTAVFSYPENSANEQFFVGAQTVVSLLQTSQIISDVCFMLPCCLRQLKLNKNRLNRDGTSFFLFLPGVFVYLHAWPLVCFHSHISTRDFRRAVTASVDSCAEIKSAPTVA